MYREDRKFFKTLILISILVFLLYGCGGGSNQTSPSRNSQTYIWNEATPESVGLSPLKVDSAINYAMTDGLYSQSAIIVKNEKIIGEGYKSLTELEKNNLLAAHSALTSSFLENNLSNKNSSSLVQSWSVGKSFTSVIFGIAEFNGLLSINSKASDYLNEWLNDERRNITIKNLLDMRSGLHRGCYGSSQNDEIGNCNEILGASTIGGGDIAKANNQLTGCINQTFNTQQYGTYNAQDQSSYYLYSNCDTMILGEIFYRATNINIKSYAETYLFSKLDISADWWKDNAGNGQDNGNYLSYCCIDMTARDFIKFGQLLLNDGIWNEERIISSSFVQQIKDLTTYGLKFWYASNTFISNASPSVSKFIFANGFDGQYILIDFENNIIVARNSLYYPALDISQTKKMIAGSLGETNFIVTVPTIITTNGETRLTQNFNPFTMLYNLYSP